MYAHEFERVIHASQPVAIANTPVLAYYVAKMLAENGWLVRAVASALYSFVAGISHWRDGET